MTILLALMGCKNEPEQTTWHQDVRPIAEERCGSCHSAGAVAPIVFDHDTVELLAEQIVDSVETGRMPPFGMDADCRDVLGDPRLSEDELAVLRAWAEEGYAMGEDPGTAFEAPVLEPRGEHAFVATPVEPFVPDLDEPDDYRCMSTDLVFEEDTWVIGSEVLPDELAIVHHVIAYAVQPSGLEQMRAMEDEDEAPGFDCFNGAVTGLPVEALGFWVPGVGAWYQDPDGAEVGGIRVPAGAQVLLEMHYNSAAVGLGQEMSDSTQLGLWTLPAGEDPTHRRVELGSWAYHLDIEAGDPASVHSASSTWPIEGELVGSAPHMHQIGTRLEMELLKTDGSEHCVSDVDWDFDWQYSYTYAPEARVPLELGDRFEITCTYDNSAGTQDVSWGDGTYDEMCLDGPVVLVPYQATTESGVCGGWGDCAAGCEPEDLSCLLTCATSSGGMSCLECVAYEGMWSDEAYAMCTTEMTQLYTCWGACPTVDDDIFGCLLEDCEAEATAYADCWSAGLALGDITDAEASCEGLKP